MLKRGSWSTNPEPLRRTEREMGFSRKKIVVNQGKALWIWATRTARVHCWARSWLLKIKKRQFWSRPSLILPIYPPAPMWPESLTHLHQKHREAYREASSQASVHMELGCLAKGISITHNFPKVNLLRSEAIGQPTSASGEWTKACASPSNLNFLHPSQTQLKASGMHNKNQVCLAKKRSFFFFFSCQTISWARTLPGCWVKDRTWLRHSIFPSTLPGLTGDGDLRNEQIWSFKGKFPCSEIRLEHKTPSFTIKEISGDFFFSFLLPYLWVMWWTTEIHILICYSLINVLHFSAQRLKSSYQFWR